MDQRQPMPEERANVAAAQRQVLFWNHSLCLCSWWHAAAAWWGAQVPFPPWSITFWPCR